MTQANKNTQKVIFFAALIGLTLFDIWFDFKHGMQAKHLIFELVILLLSLIGVNYFLSKWLSYNKKNKESLNIVNAKLEDKEVQVDSLKQQLKSYKSELKTDILNTFKKWKLTKAETEISILLLKGLALKEIAETRKSNESTVRAQCTSIYKKSNLKGRSQFSSYFLDGII